MSDLWDVSDIWEILDILVGMKLILVKWEAGT